MTLGIVGSRDFMDFDLMQSVLDCIKFDSAVSGGAKGTDTLAERYCKIKNIPINIIKPEYTKFGRVAPIIRNKQIVMLSDKIIAFWDGKSKGTLNTINFAKKNNKPVEIITI